MGLRKMNAGISLLTTVMVLAHAICLGVWMLSQGSLPKPVNFLPWAMLILMLLHAMISIDLAISAHSGVEKRPVKQYPKMNRPTIFQRISGMLLIVFTALHVAGAAGFMQPPQFVHAVVPTLFFTLTLAHVAISANKALITLGIGNAGFIKTAGIAVKVICAVTLVMDIVGFYLFKV